MIQCFYHKAETVTFFILKINKVTVIWKTCVLFAPHCRYSSTHVLALLGCCAPSYLLNSRLCVLLSRLAIKPWFLSSPLHSLVTTQAELSCCNLQTVNLLKIFVCLLPCIMDFGARVLPQYQIYWTNYPLLSAPKYLFSTLCSLYVTITTPSQICAVDCVLSFEANYELLRIV
jgi:hypothetical protein